MDELNDASDNSDGLDIREAGPAVPAGISSSSLQKPTSAASDDDSIEIEDVHYAPPAEPGAATEQAGNDAGAEEGQEEYKVSEPKADIDFSAHADDIKKSSATKSGSPQQLNKQFIVTAVCIVFFLVFIVTFLIPHGGSKKSQAKDKPVAEDNRLLDFEGMVPKKENPDAAADSSVQPPAADGGNADSDAGEVTIPPVVNPDYQDKSQKPSQSGGYSGTGGGVEIPDTRNDRLQGKNISGIKGLTSTQKDYATDYDDTKAKNSAETADLSNPYAKFGLPSKSDYIAQAAASASYGGSDEYTTQNNQAAKSSFIKNNSTDTAGNGTWLGLNTIWEGSIIEAVLTSALNTDLPGGITARIAKNIYSSQDGRFLLIPQNSILIGTYSSSISYSQSRAQVVWTRIIRPDGYQIDLGGMDGTDSKGAAGISGMVNDHPLAYVKAVALMSVFSAISSEFQSAASDATNNQYVQNIAANSQEIANQLGDKLLERAMNVQPTISIAAGATINVLVNKTISLPPVSRIPVSQQYKRAR